MRVKLEKVQKQGREASLPAINRSYTACQGWIDVWAVRFGIA